MQVLLGDVGGESFPRFRVATGRWVSGKGFPSYIRERY